MDFICDSVERNSDFGTKLLLSVVDDILEKNKNPEGNILEVLKNLPQSELKQLKERLICDKEVSKSDLSIFKIEDEIIPGYYYQHKTGFIVLEIPNSFYAICKQKEDKSLRLLTEKEQEETKKYDLKIFKSEKEVIKEFEKLKRIIKSITQEKDEETDEEYSKDNRIISNNDGLIPCPQRDLNLYFLHEWDGELQFNEKSVCIASSRKEACRIFFFLEECHLWYTDPCSGKHYEHLNSEEKEEAHLSQYDDKFRVWIYEVPLSKISGIEDFLLEPFKQKIINLQKDFCLETLRIAFSESKNTNLSNETVKHIRRLNTVI
jgi:hypothetical protein